MEFYVATWEPVDLESAKKDGEAQSSAGDDGAGEKGARKTFPAHEVMDTASGRVSVTIGGLFPGLPYRFVDAAVSFFFFWADPQDLPPEK